MKGVMRFGKKGKLSPRYIGPYRIIRRVGQVAYELELPSELESVHPVFHVSMLRKCIGDPTRVVPTDDVQITEDLSYEEIPVAILDRQIRNLRNKEVASVKVLWRSKNVEEMTWESEEEMKSKYPHLFQTEDMARDGMLQHSSIQASRSSGKLLFFTFNIYDLRSVRQIAAIYKDWPCVACIVYFLAACRLVLT